MSIIDSAVWRKALIPALKQTQVDLCELMRGNFLETSETEMPGLKSCHKPQKLLWPLYIFPVSLDY